MGHWAKMGLSVASRYFALPEYTDNFLSSLLYLQVYLRPFVLKQFRWYLLETLETLEQYVKSVQS